MQTHDDRDARSEFLRALQDRADRMVANRKSEITAGRPDEEELANWKHGDMQVRHLPDDEQGICRISVGGTDKHGLNINYLVFRGSVGDCESLLRKALAAITKYQ